MFKKMFSRMVIILVVVGVVVGLAVQIHRNMRSDGNEMLRKLDRIEKRGGPVARPSFYL